MHKKILFLGRKPIAETCIKWLMNYYYGEIKIFAAVTDTKFYENVFSRYECSTIFIDNSQRNDDEIIKLLEENDINYIISIQHKWILTKRTIQAVYGNALNLHNAKIPEYRGYNSLSHEILNGDESHTSTIHWMDEKVDLGDIAYEESIKIQKDDTAYSLYKKSIDASFRNFKKLINDIARNRSIPRKPINGNEQFYCKNSIHKLKEVKNIKNYEEVDKKARAFYFPPYEPAYFILNGEKFYVTTSPY